MKKYSLWLLTVILLGGGIALNAQTADGGIFGSGSTLYVRFTPSADITGAFTGGNFGIRWLSSLGAGVNLSGETGTFGYINQGPKATSGLYDYIIYASGSNIVSTTYLGGNEYTLMTVTVSGGVGTGTFELCPSGFAGDAGQWYIEIGGADRANPNPALWYYQPTASNVPLPVELTSFAAKIYDQDKVKLNWKTQTEVNNYGFDVERQTINGQWEKVGFVNGNGNSNSPKQYSYIDKNLIGGSKFLYRLKQVDNDGQFEYSDIVEIGFIPNKFELYQNYPNPFNPSSKIRYQLPKESKVVIKVYNILGSEVIELVNEQKEAGSYEAEFNASNLSSGTYIYKISADNYVQTKKMILLK